MEEVKEGVIEKDVINVEADISDDGFGNMKIKVNIQGNNEPMEIEINNLQPMIYDHYFYLAG